MKMLRLPKSNYETEETKASETERERNNSEQITERQGRNARAARYRDNSTHEPQIQKLTEP